MSLVWLSSFGGGYVTSAGRAFLISFPLLFKLRTQENVRNVARSFDIYIGILTNDVRGFLFVQREPFFLLSFFFWVVVYSKCYLIDTILPTLCIVILSPVNWNDWNLYIILIVIKKKNLSFYSG